MESLATAARLLTRCNSVENVATLLGAIGFGSASVPLLEESVTALGLPATIAGARIIKCAGALRVLVFECDDADLREQVARVSNRLAAHAPQLLWILAAVAAHRGEFVLAVSDTSASRPRIAALAVRTNNIVDSDSETICALASSVSSVDVLTHCRWREVLGRQSVGRRFFNELKRTVGNLASSLPSSVSPDDRAELALLMLSRLIFLSFMETKGWLDRDHSFLSNRFGDCMVAGGGYHRRVLAPLFFGTLNTHPQKRAVRALAFGRIPFLNGGLFSRSPVDGRTAQVQISDEVLGDVFADVLTRYRFTAREDAMTWTEAAIDPEMLGRAFESLMSPDDRKSSGAFYTPQSLVHQVSERAIIYALESPSLPAMRVAEALRRPVNDSDDCLDLLGAIRSCRLLDPACGSGSFLVHLLEELAGFCTRLGDGRPLHLIRREILTRSIFGVDINPTAVWLCELRLWLSMAIEDPETDPLRVKPLPNLDRNIRVGDSLGGDAFVATTARWPGKRIATMRGRYARATGPRKKSLARSLDMLERTCAIANATARIDSLRHRRLELLIGLRSPDLFGRTVAPSREAYATLASWRSDLRKERAGLRRLRDGGALSFSFSTGFGDVAAEGGFAIVVGNPPWVRTGNMDGSARSSLRGSYTVYRNAAWMAGSVASAAGRGFGSQVDSAALFVERSAALLKPGGVLSLIVPAKLWKSLAGGGTRDLLLRTTAVREVHDLTRASSLFDAAVFPSIIVATAPPSVSGAAHIRIALQDDRGVSRWTTAATDLPLDASPGSPWLLVPEDVRRSFSLVAEAGVPLAESTFGRPLLGAKTGCNEAFIVQCGTSSVAVALEDEVSAQTSRGLIRLESRLLRPLVRGESIRRWTVTHTDERILWPHDDKGSPLAELPPRAARWLAGWRTSLEQRSDAGHRRAWWEIFRTESADDSLPRVVWSDFGKRPRAAVIPAGDRSVPINTSYVVRCAHGDDALALAALLNSSIVAAWLDVIAEPARGGFHRYLGWTMSLLPIPVDWERAKTLLAPISVGAAAGQMPSDHELTGAVLDAYSIEHNDTAALLAWNR
ncbi:MAG: hypothetical protein ABIS03_11925 [Gemmatimonadaceae bacterium]